MNGLRLEFLLRIDIFNKFNRITTHFVTHEGKYLFTDQPPVNLILGGAESKNMDEWFDIFMKEINIKNME